MLLLWKALLRLWKALSKALLWCCEALLLLWCEALLLLLLWLRLEALLCLLLNEVLLLLLKSLTTLLRKSLIKDNKCMHDFTKIQRNLKKLLVCEGPTWSPLGPAQCGEDEQKLKIKYKM